MTNVECRMNRSHSERSRLPRRSFMRRREESRCGSLKIIPRDPSTLLRMTALVFIGTYSAKSSRFGDWYGNKVDVVRPIVSSRKAADFFARIKAAKRESRDARDEGRGNDLHITFARFRARRIKQQ